LHDDTPAIKALPDVRSVADRDQPLRSKQELLPANPHGHGTKREIDESLVQIVAILVITARPARTANFDPTLQLSIQAHTPREPCVDVKHVALKPVTSVIRYFCAPFLVVKPLVFLPHLAAG
jgi:hypothetical protein